MTHCAQCQAAIAGGCSFCPSCGTRLLPKPSDFLGSFAERLHKLASTDRLEGFSVSEMFSEVFRKRSPEELEEYFLTGTSKATPPIEEVQTGWPKPWFFFRVLLFIVVVYFGFSWIMQTFGNTKAIPGMIMMGALSVPLATLILFFEFNTPRNVTFHQTIMLMTFGGMLSLVFTHIEFATADLSWLGAMSAGILEESAKLLTVLVLVRSSRYPYILNGMLFGAAVGAGFEVFEIAGYAFDRVMRTHNLLVMESEIQLRAFTAPFGHAAWTAISAAAWWRAAGGKRFSPAFFLEPNFWKAFLIPVGLHMFYNSPLPSPLYIKEAIVAAVSWIVILGFLQQGLRQVRHAQQKAAQTILRQTRQMP
jgi:RsiW-degrading membrane proteinase PrsW (M82 family)